MGTIVAPASKSSPVATTDTTLYTCPSSTEFVGKIYATNRAASTASKIRIAVVLDGDSIANSDYIVYDFSLEAGDSKYFGGIALSAGDYVVVRTENATVSFVMMGMETT